MRDIERFPRIHRWHLILGSYYEKHSIVFAKLRYNGIFKQAFMFIEVTKCHTV